jgi:hypothetical protein
MSAATGHRTRRPTESVARKDSPWLSAVLIAGIVGLAFVLLKDVTWFHRGSQAEVTVEKKRESPMEWQSRIWKEGFAEGERYGASGAEPLSLDAIKHRSDVKFPRDRTSDTLWGMGFESGQLRAIRSQRLAGTPGK